MTTSELKAKLPKKERIDYFLIWGHGLPFEDRIIRMIRNEKDLEILMIKYHKPASMEELVEAVYSYDYAPIEHLRGKTDYLKQVPLSATFIFVRNTDPHEQHVGDGEFKHVECLRIKALKNKIRDLYNPRDKGARTEHHVIHASDNEMQTHQIMIYLGYAAGVIHFIKKPNSVLNLPFHLGSFTNFHLLAVNLDSIKASILEKTTKGFEHKQIPLDETPHYKSLATSRSHYDRYRKHFKEKITATDDHYWRNFSRLKSMEYLTGPHINKYILLEQTGEKEYIIRDGLHRASILKYKGVKSIIAAVINVKENS